MSKSFDRYYVKYVPVGYVSSHNIVLAYCFWVLGFFGLHRFYLGRPLTGLLWALTFGLLGVGWIIDLFLIPGMVQQCNRRYQLGRVDYNIAWLLFYVGGFFGLHRFYQGKILTGVVFLFTGGILGLGWLFDLLSMNEQIDDVNEEFHHSLAYDHYCPVC
jgi:TM2 domain-containing membrane protein YozV